MLVSQSGSARGKSRTTSDDGDGNDLENAEEGCRPVQFLHIVDLQASSRLGIIRQWIHPYEAGITEGRGVFEMRHLKVRAAPSRYLQEQFAVFLCQFRALGSALAGDAVPTASIELARGGPTEGERAGQGRCPHVSVG